MSTTASRAAAKRTPLALASRVGASLLGGYAFTWGLSCLGIALLVFWGMAFDQARTLCMLLAFLVFLIVFLWAYAARSALQVWLVLLGGGVAMAAAGLGVQQLIIGG